MATYNCRISKSDSPLAFDSCLFASASLSSASKGTALTPIAAMKGTVALMILLMLYMVREVGRYVLKVIDVIKIAFDEIEPVSKFGGKGD